jgi:hypothetical protein
MELDSQKFFEACVPSRTLVPTNIEDRQYYIDFSEVRGEQIIRRLARTIHRLPNIPTCQLFTGYLGCGKSTELRRLEEELKRKGFHVVYFESDEDLDMTDVDVSDILLATVRQVSQSLEAIGIKLKPKYFENLFSDVVNFLQTPIDLSGEFSLPLGLGKITAKTKDSPSLRSKLRGFLEPRTDGILDSINREVLGVATEKLQQQGQRGLVVLIDNLDKIDHRPNPNGSSQPKYLFVDRGNQLRKLNCHVVYTIPLSLVFSKEQPVLTNILGGGLPPAILPMVPVQLRDGSVCKVGMNLLRRMVMKRAFPNVETPESQLELITEVFDSSDTLDRLCYISGGHVRTLLGLLYGCLQDSDPPISRSCLEQVIRLHRRGLNNTIAEPEWELLREVVQTQSISGEAGYDTLLRSLFVFEYQDDDGNWFSINPALAETQKYKSWQQSND